MISALVAHPIGSMSGFLIWGAHFLFVYGITALACAKRFADVEILNIGIVPFVTGVATVAALAAAALVLVGALRALPNRAPVRRDETGGPSVFLRWLTALVAGLSLVAIAWNGLPILLVPVCA